MYYLKLQQICCGHCFFPIGVVMFQLAERPDQEISIRRLFATVGVCAPSFLVRMWTNFEETLAAIGQQMVSSHFVIYADTDSKIVRIKNPLLSAAVYPPLETELQRGATFPDKCLFSL